MLVQIKHVRFRNNFFFFFSNVVFVYTFQSYSFLISSDYERAEWKEIIKEQQKKCKRPRNVTFNTFQCGKAFEALDTFFNQTQTHGH